MNDTSAVIDYNQIVGDISEYQEGVANNNLGKLVCMALHRAYPFRDWSVYADCRGGIIGVKLDSVDGSNGFIIKLAHNTLHDIEEMAKKGAGEILERFNLSRTSGKNFNDEVKSLKRDARGNALQA